MVLRLNHLESSHLLNAFRNFWCVIVGNSFVYCHWTLILVLFLTLDHLANVLRINCIRHVTICSHWSTCEVKQFLLVRVWIIMVMLGYDRYLTRNSINNIITRVVIKFKLSHSDSAAHLLILLCVLEHDSSLALLVVCI